MSILNASLALNSQDQLALFYDEPLGFAPEWASIDIDKGEIYIGGADTENQAFKLDTIDQKVYERVKRESQILIVQVDQTEDKNPIEALFLPLMIPQQI